MPVFVHVSQATRAFSSSLRQQSRMESDIISQILSGWPEERKKEGGQVNTRSKTPGSPNHPPSFTDSLVNRKFPGLGGQIGVAMISLG